MVNFSSCDHPDAVNQWFPFQTGTEGGYVCIFDVVADGVMYNRALEKQEGQTLVKHFKLTVILRLLLICLHNVANVLLCYAL